MRQNKGLSNNLDRETHMQTALIWGAAGGIGRALVDTLRENGWRVLGIARDAAALSDMDIEAYSAELSREADVAAAALWAAQQSEGAVNLWVYAAGDMIGKPLADTTASEWERIFGANVTGAHLAVTHSLALVPVGRASGFHRRVC
jgi:NAD(P)-dependent dehydrogenase (short-subunit alcohol dehydrogenase family)